MATIKDTAATSALNEEKYINELYDSNDKAQKQILGDNYTANTENLDNVQETVRQNTEEALDRTAAEAPRTAAPGSRLSAGAQAQAALVQDNAQKKNVTTLRTAQSEADAEVERQRQLLASQYETAIRQAQADNDMERAQALYDAAKAEEAQLLEMQKSGADLLYRKRQDMTGYDAIAAGETIARDTEGDSWEEVLKNEDELNAIYDAKLESLMLELQAEEEQKLSDLEAQQRQKEQDTDDALTKAYVEGLKSRKNSGETQNAYGQSSGMAAAGQQARAVETAEEMTELRRAQLAYDADVGMERFDIGADVGDRRAAAQHDTDLQRALALYDAAEDEEQTLVENQLLLGQILAEKNDYSLLGELYGLTPDQIDKLHGGSGGGAGGGSPRTDWANLSNRDRKAYLAAGGTPPEGAYTKGWV